VAMDKGLRFAIAKAAARWALARLTEVIK